MPLVAKGLGIRPFVFRQRPVDAIRDVGKVLFSAVFQTINEQKPSRKTEGWAIFGQHLEGIHQTGTSRQKNSRGLAGHVIRGFKEIRNTTFRRAG